MYMESRKLLLMNLFGGSSRDADIDSRLVDAGGKGEGGVNETVPLRHARFHVQTHTASGVCSRTQGH